MTQSEMLALVNDASGGQSNPMKPKAEPAMGAIDLPPVSKDGLFAGTPDEALQNQSLNTSTTPQGQPRGLSPLGRALQGNGNVVA